MLGTALQNEVRKRPQWLYEAHGKPTEIWRIVEEEYEKTIEEGPNRDPWGNLFESDEDHIDEINGGVINSIRFK